MFNLSNKKNLPCAILFFFSVLISNALQAANLTWIGGEGYWHMESNWDTGTVPESGDYITIPSGGIAIINVPNAKCNNIVIKTEASLLIATGGVLSLNTGDALAGIHVDGKLVNDGHLILNSYYNGSNKLHLFAIYNNGSVTLKGTTNITNFKQGGIYNETDARVEINDVVNISSNTLSSGINNKGIFNMKGTLTLQSKSSRIVNESTGNFTNSGTIEIANANTGASGSLANKGYFKNNSNGVIDIRDIITTSSIISSFQSTARFDNLGDIYSIDNVITGASVAVNSSGRFYNYATGNIYVENCTGKGISSSSNGDFRNLGVIDLHEVTGSGVHASSSVIKNFSSGTISYNEGSHHGVSLWVNSVLQNYGTITVSNSPDRSLFCFNNSSFINQNTGKFEIDNSIYLTHPDGLINYGHLSCKYNGNHYVPTNGIKNYGAIGDQYESLNGDFNNSSGVRVIPFQGNVHINVPVANALDLGSLNNVSIESWTTTPNGSTSAGTYNASNNTFTPNENAKDLYQIYVRVEISGTSNSYVYPVPIPGGVQYFTGGGSNNFVVQGNKHRTQEAATRSYNNTSTISFKTYPNPTSDILFVETNSAFDENLSIQFLNYLGQTLWQEEIVNGESRVSFPIPGSLANGDYVLTLWKNGEIIKTEKVVVVH